MKSSIQTQTVLPTTTTQEDEQQQRQRLYMPALSSFKACCLAVGILVGFFIYLSTLGAEFVAVMLWGKEILAKSNNDLILFSLSWNLATTCVALVILTCLRRMVSTVFKTVHHSAENVEEMTTELLSYLEGRFAVGALVGICISWNITNMILGMRPQIIQSCVILIVAVAWCRVTLILIGGGCNNEEESLIYDSLEEDEQEHEHEQKQQTTTTITKNELGEPLLVNGV